VTLLVTGGVVAAVLAQVALGTCLSNLFFKVLLFDPLM
jgi:hypothetical protein